MNKPKMPRKRNILTNNHKLVKLRTTKVAKRLKQSEVKSVESSSDISKLSNDKYSKIIHVNNDEATIPFSNSVKAMINQDFILPNELERNNIKSLDIPKIKTSNSISSVENTKIINNVNKDNDCDAPKRRKTIKKQRTKISKSIFSFKKKPEVNKINKNDKPDELKTSDNYVSSKVSNKTSKSITPAKKKAAVNNLGKNNKSIEIENNDNIVTPKSSKSKASESVTTIEKKCEHQNDVMDVLNDEYDLFEFQDLVPSKTKNKNDVKNTKKKSVVNNVNKNGTSFELDESKNLVVPMKRGGFSTKKKQLKKTKVYGIRVNRGDLKSSQSLAKHRKKIQSLPETVPRISIDDDNKYSSQTLNIKKKWTYKWTDKWREGNSLSHDVLETCDCCFCDTPKLINTSIQTQKPKYSSYKKIKTKMIEKFVPAINNLNTSFGTDNSTTTLLVTQSCDNSLTVNSIPSTESVVSNVVLTELVELESIDNVPCNQVETTSYLPKITIDFIHTTNSSSPHGNDQTPRVQESTFDPNDSPIPVVGSEFNELNYGMAILSEAIRLKCSEVSEKNDQMKSPEKEMNDVNEAQSSSDETDCVSKIPVTSPTISPERGKCKIKSKKTIKYPLKLLEPSVESDFESSVERQLILFSNRFNLPINYLTKTVIEEPVTIFHKHFSKSINPSMLTICPIESEIDLRKITRNYLDLKYDIEPIRECIAHEISNLRDLMTEISKYMPSWSLSIVSDPPRYVISHMTIDIYGIPFANKCIVLDKSFRASVFINQRLKYMYCKRYKTATEIINLINELNSQC